MKNIKYETKNEEKLIKAIQRKINTLDNGIIGNDTLTTLAGILTPNIFPLTLELYGLPCIIGYDIIAFNPQNKGIYSYTNSMVGSFTYPRAKQPCSILVNNYEVIHNYSCHAYYNKPESVLYKNDKNEIKIKRIMYIAEIEEKIKWAVGGCGLLSNYDPDAEGFTGKNAGVVNYDKHIVLGYKNGMLYGVYFKDADGKIINDICKNKFMFKYAIILDGGGLAAMNGTEKFGKINIYQKQGYAIQFV